MFSLGWRLLPYLMTLGGLLLTLGTLPTIIGGAETASTSVPVDDVTADGPKARWLNVTGGGLYLPDAVVDEQVKKSTGARKTKAWFVPLISEAEAIDRAKSIVGATTRPAAKKLILVRFDADEFLRKYPTPDTIKTEDVFRAGPVDGLRTSNVLFPQRLKDYVRSELQLPLESVVVVKYGDVPLQRGPAITMAAVMSGIALLGVLWIVARFRRPNATSIPVA